MLTWLKRAETLRTIREFLAEAAVLVAVFPVLDTLIPSQGSAATPKHIWITIAWSLGGALFLLIMALNIPAKE